KERGQGERKGLSASRVSACFSGRHPRAGTVPGSPNGGESAVGSSAVGRIPPRILRIGTDSLLTVKRKKWVCSFSYPLNDFCAARHNGLVTELLRAVPPGMVFWEVRAARRRRTRRPLAASPAPLPREKIANVPHPRVPDPGRPAERPARSPRGRAAA